MRRRKATLLDNNEYDLPSGTVIAEGVVPGRAVPWKAPTVGRNGGCYSDRSYGAYRTWKQVVGLRARQDMRRKRPYGGPVRLDVIFVLRPKGNQPDRTNLLKAFEDALQGIVIANDRQVIGGDAELIMSATEAERVEFRVTAATESFSRYLDYISNA